MPAWAVWDAVIRAVGVVGVLDLAADIAVEVVGNAADGAVIDGRVIEVVVVPPASRCGTEP